MMLYSKLTYMLFSSAGMCAPQHSKIILPIYSPGISFATAKECLMHANATLCTIGTVLSLNMSIQVVGVADLWYTDHLNEITSLCSHSGTTPNDNHEFNFQCVYNVCKNDSTVKDSLRWVLYKRDQTVCTHCSNYHCTEVAVSIQCCTSVEECLHAFRMSEASHLIHENPSVEYFVLYCIY